jgi:hypothetical protein
VTVCDPEGTPTVKIMSVFLVYVGRASAYPTTVATFDGLFYCN